MVRTTLAALAIAGSFANTAPGDVFVFTDREEFRAFNLSVNKFLKGIETFQEGDVPDGVSLILDDPLQGNVPNVSPFGGFPSGLEHKNLIVQSNLLGLNAPHLAPRGTEGLFVVGADAGLPGIPESVTVAAHFQGDSLDLIFLEPNHTAIGFDALDLDLGGLPGAVFHISVFSMDNETIIEEVVPAPFEKTFFGISSDQTIGRINIGGMWEGSPGVELVDDIEMWQIPGPGTLALLGLAGLMGTRRRRRS
jgi:hypothetical protein